LDEEADAPSLQPLSSARQTIAVNIPADMSRITWLLLALLGGNEPGRLLVAVAGFGQLLYIGRAAGFEIHDARMIGRHREDIPVGRIHADDFASCLEGALLLQIAFAIGSAAKADELAIG